MGLDGALSEPALPEDFRILVSCTTVTPVPFINMNPSQPETPGGGIQVDDILFTVFRHKWKIVICTAVGLLAAAAVYLVGSRSYQSDAQLLVRYVLDRSAIDQVNSQVDPSSR